MKTIAIGCRTIEDEINAVLKKLPNPMAIIWIESGLHNFPNRLKDRIQDEIDKISGVENIVLLFGYCGNSIEGLCALKSQLVVPKVDDCISMLLGGNEVRFNLNRKSAAYYLTEGWLRYENNIYYEYEHCLKKYGPAKALRIFRAMLAHYRTLNFIDTGSYKLEPVMAKTAELAASLNLLQEVVPGTLRLIDKALREEWDDDFLKVPQGVPLHLELGGASPNQL